MNKIRLIASLLLAALIPNLQAGEEKNYVEMWFRTEKIDPEDEKHQTWKDTMSADPRLFLKVLINTQVDTSTLLKVLEIDKNQDSDSIKAEIGKKYSNIIIKLVKMGDRDQKFYYVNSALPKSIEGNIQQMLKKFYEELKAVLEKRKKVKIYTEEQAKERAASNEYKQGEVRIIGSSGNLIPQQDFIKNGGKEKEDNKDDDTVRPWTNSEKFGLGMGITLMATILTWGLYQKFMQKKGKEDLKEVE